MKIRNGFVSNSSSSSFICVFGEITNKTNLEEILRKNETKNYYIKTSKAFKELLNRNHYDNVGECYWAKVNLQLDEFKFKNKKEYFYLEQYQDFYGDDDGNVDYDSIEYEDFECSKTIDLIYESGCLKDIKMQFGAGHDG